MATLKTTRFLRNSAASNPSAYARPAAMAGPIVAARIPAFRARIKRSRPEGSGKRKVAAVELEPLAGSPGKRGFEAMIACYEAGLMTRIAGDTFEFSPPLIASRSHLDEIFEIFQRTLRALG
jgi:hypothetical protein